LPQELHDRLPRLIELGVIEAQGRGRGTRYFISRRFYDFVGKKGTYTRKRGLDRETNKALLLKHIQDNKEEGSRFEELSQVLPAQSRGAIQRLMGELKDEGRIHVVGRTKAARWYPGPAKQDIAS
jgi:ATP-dependent DNA helicase RecG